MVKDCAAKVGLCLAVVGHAEQRYLGLLEAHLDPLQAPVRGFCPQSDTWVALERQRSPKSID